MIYVIFRFVAADPRSDEVVLMKIMAVLRTLMLTPVGLLITNEGVCEILQSTCRICFETRLSDLLRKTAELTLNDMIQLLFTRLPTFTEENLPLLKVRKSQKQFFLNLHCPKRDRHFLKDFCPSQMDQIEKIFLISILV